MDKITFQARRFGFHFWVGALALLEATIGGAWAAPSPAALSQKSAPPLIELSPFWGQSGVPYPGLSDPSLFRGRSPASVSLMGGSSSNSILGLLIRSEPTWYRNTAALGHGLGSWVGEGGGWGSRAPAHPSDGMWRSYDSPGLSR